MGEKGKHDDEVDGVGVSLPEDIIFDVLVRLPAKSLCRFRCVSKAWRALISDPALVAAQRSRAGRLIVATLWRTSSSTSHELRVLDMDGNVQRVLQTMESPLLVPTRLDLVCVDRMRHGAMIMDPAAGRAFTVGRNDDPSDKFTWSHSGFGRATPSGSYKLLRLHQTMALPMGCEVATIRATDVGGEEPAWRQRPPAPFLTSFSCDHKAAINGVLYFMPHNAYDARTHGWNCITTFDLESEEWMETINGPQVWLVGFKEVRIVLAELNGALCMVHNVRYPGHPNLAMCSANIWRLVDSDKSLWVQEYMIHLPTWCSYIKPLDVLADGRILLLNKSRNGRYILQFFNPSTKDFIDIMDMAHGFCGRIAFYTGGILS